MPEMEHPPVRTGVGGHCASIPGLGRALRDETGGGAYRAQVMQGPVGHCEDFGERHGGC